MWRSDSSYEFSVAYEILEQTGQKYQSASPVSHCNLPALVLWLLKFSSAGFSKSPMDNRCILSKYLVTKCLTPLPGFHDSWVDWRGHAQTMTTYFDLSRYHTTCDQWGVTTCISDSEGILQGKIECVSPQEKQRKWPDFTANMAEIGRIQLFWT